MALRPFDDDWFELLVHRHELSSHEHIALSSKSLSSCYNCAPTSDHYQRLRRLRRGGRAVDRAGLENRKAERPREFESHPLRAVDYQALTKETVFSIKDLRNIAGGKNAGSSNSCTFVVRIATPWY